MEKKILGFRNMQEKLEKRFNIICLSFFRFLSKLVSVDLSHNHIVSISDKAFARNSDMNHLKLDGNKIAHVSNKTFYGLSNVEVISLRGNAIENLPEHLFKFAPKVQKIDLARNSINSMHAQAFQVKIVIL